MNILFIANELGYRKAPHYLINCAALAKKAGHKVLIWAVVRRDFPQPVPTTLKTLTP